MALAPEPPVAPDTSQAVSEKRTRFGGALREFAETLLLTLVIFLTVRVIVQNYKVDGFSMEPSLHDSQYLLVNKLVYPGRFWPGFREPNRGDVIVFRYPGNLSQKFIKRIIGLPGEMVEVGNGVVYIDGEPLDEPYLKERPRYIYPRKTLAPNEYFVLGDNRNNSHDSHVWGPLPRVDLIGEAWVRYWPLSDAGTVPNAHYAYNGHASSNTVRAAGH